MGRRRRAAADDRVNDSAAPPRTLAGRAWAQALEGHDRSEQISIHRAVRATNEDRCFLEPRDEHCNHWRALEVVGGESELQDETSRHLREHRWVYDREKLSDLPRLEAGDWNQFLVRVHRLQ